jgi:hypothetical protein
MNAGQGFRRAPGNLLRVAAGAGAAALIVTAVSAARRARTAMADRERPAGATGPGTPSGPLTTATAQLTPDVSPPPATPKAATACDLAVGQVAISAALLFFSVTALSAVAGRRRADGKRGAAHARTSGRHDENGNEALPPEIPADSGDPWIMGAPRSGRQDPAWRDADESWYDGLRAQHADDHPSWPGRPGPHALHPDHPSWGGGRSDPRWDSTEAALRQDGYPSWPESAAPPWGDAEPLAANDGSGWRGGGRPARQEPPPAPYRGPDGRSATGYAPRPATVPYPGIDSRPGPVSPANFVPGPGPAHRAGYAAPGFGPQPGYLPGPGSARPGSAPRADFVPRHGPAPQPGAAGVMERVWPEVDRVPQAGRVQPAQGQVWDAASVELATWIISEANQQATEIRHEARDDAATARADAKLQAAKLVQQAADQAAATLATAELQAARIRAEILKLSADLGGVATSFTEGLLGPAKPATKPAAGPPAQLRDQAAAGVAAPPATKPAALSATDPAAKPGPKPAAMPGPKPAAMPGPKPAAKPGPKPAAKPGPKPVTRSAAAPATKPGVSPRRMKPDTQAAGQTKNRQISAARKVTATLVALTLAGVATGATELVLHGPAFFVFRANGAGASQTGPEEDQGPGQPNAPGAHHNAKVIPVKTKAKVIPAKGKHAKKDPKQAGIPD